MKSRDSSRAKKIVDTLVSLIALMVLMAVVYGFHTNVRQSPVFGERSSSYSKGALGDEDWVERNPELAAWVRSLPLRGLGNIAALCALGLAWTWVYFLPVAALAAGIARVLESLLFRRGRVALWWLLPATLTIGFSLPVLKGAIIVCLD